MARPIGEDRIEVAPGVHINLHDNGVWRVRFKLDGAKKAVRRSLKTKDLAEAKKRALEISDQARLRMKTGKPASKVSFSKLADDYLVSMGNRGSKTYHAKTIKRHLEPFFSIHVPDFSNVTSSDLQDYLNWRRAKLTRSGRPPKTPP